MNTGQQRERWPATAAAARWRSGFESTSQTLPLVELNVHDIAAAVAAEPFPPKSPYMPTMCCTLPVPQYWLANYTT